MNYFLIINKKTNEIFGKSTCIVENENIKCIEVTQEIFENQDKYMYDGENIVIDTDYEEKIKQKERDILNSLSLTAADIERALYKDKGIDFDDLIEIAKQYNEIQTVSLDDEPSNSKIDIKALKIELKANNFYRGHPYINQIGRLLGYSSEDLDYLFQNKELPTKENIL